MKSVYSDPRPYVDLYCDAPAHRTPLPLDRFILDPDRGWVWDVLRKAGGGSWDRQTGLRDFFDPVTHETAYEVAGHVKVDLDCRKCGLHLPMRWDAWTERLDRLYAAGVRRLHLPSLIAIVTEQ